MSNDPFLLFQAQSASSDIPSVEDKTDLAPLEEDDSSNGCDAPESDAKSGSETPEAVTEGDAQESDAPLTENCVATNDDPNEASPSKASDETTNDEAELPPQPVSAQSSSPELPEVSVASEPVDVSSELKLANGDSETSDAAPSVRTPKRRGRKRKRTASAKKKIADTVPICEKSLPHVESPAAAAAAAAAATTPAKPEPHKRPRRF